MLDIRAVVGPFVVTIASFALLVPYDLRRSQPLVDVRFFRSVLFTGAAVNALCAFGGYGVGSTVAIALVGAIVGTSAGFRFGPAFARATHPGWWLIVSFAAILFAVGAATTTPRAFASARDTAARLQPERVPG